MQHACGKLFWVRSSTSRFRVHVNARRALLTLVRVQHGPDPGCLTSERRTLAIDLHGAHHDIRGYWCGTVASLNPHRLLVPDGTWVGMTELFERSEEHHGLVDHNVSVGSSRIHAAVDDDGFA